MSSSGTAEIVVELPFVPSHTSSTPLQSPTRPSLQASASSQSPTTEQPQPPPQPQVAQSTDSNSSPPPHLPTLPRFSKSWQNLSALIAIATIPVMVYYAVKTYQLAAWTAKKDYCEYQHAYGVCLPPPAHLHAINIVCIEQKKLARMHHPVSSRKVQAVDARRCNPLDRVHSRSQRSLRRNGSMVYSLEHCPAGWDSVPAISVLVYIVDTTSHSYVCVL